MRMVYVRFEDAFADMENQLVEEAETLAAEEKVRTEAEIVKQKAIST